MNSTHRVIPIPVAITGGAPATRCLGADAAASTVRGPTDPVDTGDHRENLRSRRSAPVGTVPARRGRSTTVLVAAPDPVTVQTLSAGLHDRAVDHVLTEYTTNGAHRILADRRVGDLAMISLGFGEPAYRLIQELRGTGWPRVIALITGIDPGPVAAAFGAGATGVLRGRPTTPAGAGPAPNLKLSGRELDVLRLVADGRSNNRISRQLSLTSFTVKRDLVGIGRKFGTGNRARMVAVAIRAGLIR